MTLAEAVRKLRGSLSRPRFAQEIQAKTGIWISPEMVQAIETGVVKGFVSNSVRALLAYAPELAHLVLPQQVIDAIRK